MAAVLFIDILDDLFTTLVFEVELLDIEKPGAKPAAETGAKPAAKPVAKPAVKPAEKS